jgi:Sulfate transporter family.
MFGISAVLEGPVHPKTTLDKMVFLVENVFTHAHRPTTIVSFTALIALIFLRAFKIVFKKHWWIYRIPEVLVVVAVSTSTIFFLAIRSFTSMRADNMP